MSASEHITGPYEPSPRIKGLWRRLSRLHHVLDVFCSIQMVKGVLYYQGIIKD